MNGRWNFEPVPEAKLCPQCGAAPLLRAFSFYTTPYAVWCEDCGFYQLGTSKSEAVKKWNAATKDTVVTEPQRNDLQKDREIDHVLPLDNSTCCYCEYRKEKYPKYIPDECKECGFLKERNAPYSVGVPVYKENQE